MGVRLCVGHCFPAEVIFMLRFEEEGWIKVMERIICNMCM